MSGQELWISEVETKHSSANDNTAQQDIDSHLAQNNAYRGAAGALGNDALDELLRAGLSAVAVDGVGQRANYAQAIIADNSRGEYISPAAQYVMQWVTANAASALGDDAIQPAENIVSYLSQKAATLVSSALDEYMGQHGRAALGYVAGEVSSRIASAAGVSDADAAAAVGLLDADADGVLSAAEMSAVGNPYTQAQLLAINPAIRRLLVNPSYASRLIQRKKTPSIYGPNFYEQFNQVELAEQSAALDFEGANQFNVAFAASAGKP